MEFWVLTAGLLIPLAVGLAVVLGLERMGWAVGRRHRAAGWAIVALVWCGGEALVFGSFHNVRVERHGIVQGVKMDDFLLADPFAYRLGEPRRRDVVAIQTAPATYALRRIVAVPGEKVAVRDARVHVDGRPLDEPYLIRTARAGSTPIYRSLDEVAVPPGSIFVLLHPIQTNQNQSPSRILALLFSYLLRSSRIIFSFQYISHFSFHCSEVHFSCLRATSKVVK